MDYSEPTEAICGEILAHGPGSRHFRIRLEDGQEIVAILPTKRTFGCLFGSLVGWKVSIVLRQAPRMPRIVTLEKPVPPTGAPSG